MSDGRFSITAAFRASVGNLPRVFGQVETASSRLMRTTAAAAARAQSSLSSIVAKTDRAVAFAANSAKAAAMIGGAGVAAAAVNVVTAGANFEEAITAVGAVSLMTRDQIADLQKQALELGSSTKYTATQVANGMELMGRAGFENNQIIAAMPGLLAAAAAEGGELSETVGIVSNTLKGFGLAASETQRVADVLTLASARTNSSITSLGESLKNVAPIARQFSIPMEDATAAVALLQDVGIDASEAGNATSTMLTMLAAPTKEASKQMAALGIKIADVHGDMLPLPQIFQQFSDAAKEAGGNAKAAAVFSDLLGMRGQRAGINLTNAFASGAFGKLVDQLNQAEGSAKRMADLRMQNLKGDWELLTGAVDGASTAIYQLQSGALRSVTKAAAEWVSQNQGLLVQRVDQWASRAGRAIKEATPIVIGFTSGLAAGARDVAGGLNTMRPPLVWTIDTVGKLFGSGDKDRAENFGRTLVLVGSGFVAISAAARVATGLKWGYTAATFVAQGITWAFTGSVVKSAEALTAQAGATTIANTATTGALGGLGRTALMFGRIAVLAGIATAAYKAWSSAIDQNESLTKETGGIGWWDAMKMHPKELRDEIERRQNEKARARNPENAAAWAQRQYGDVSAAQVARSSWAVDAPKAATDVATTLKPAISALDKQIATLSKMPGVDVSAIKELESTLAVATQASSLGFDPKTAENAAAASKQIEQLTTTLKSLQVAMPAGAAPTSPAAPNGAPIGPAVAPMLAPQLVVPREQSEEMARIIAAEVRRALKETQVNVTVNGASGTASGNTNGAPSPRTPRVTDSGAM
jgi:TP901 family phage tail tape measure protein